MSKRNAAIAAAFAVVAVAGLLLWRAARSGPDRAAPPPPEVSDMDLISRRGGPSRDAGAASRPRPTRNDDEGASASDSDPASASDPASDPASGSAEPRIFVRPVPGATNIPDEITPESLANIVVQRDAAPEGSEAEAEQAVTRLFRDKRYEDAREEALEHLDQFPENGPMRRLVVSSSCIMNDAETAREHFARLEGADRYRAKSRCKKYGIALDEPRLR